MLADLQARARSQEDLRKRNLRRAYALAAVAVVHVLFVILLVASEWRLIPLPKPQKLEPLKWVWLPRPAHSPEETRIKPLSPEVGNIDTNKIPILPRPKEEENNAITDLGWALGRSLACGANSYEWLNSKMRAECRHRPWAFVYDRYGNIVLDARERIPQEETLRPSDVQAQERNTAPVCPRNIDPNAPCLSAVIGGH